MNKIIIILSIILYRVGIFRLIRWLNRNRLTIISYHSPKLEIIDKHFKYLSKIYRFISMDDYYEIVQNGGNLPQYSLVLTFDDGHKSNAALLLVFIKYNVRPVIYLCSQIVGTSHPFWWKILEKGESPEKYKKLCNSERLELLRNSGKYDPEQTLLEPQGLTRDDIMKLKGHVTFGSHTRTHPILTKCIDEEQEQEIIESKIELEDLCGESIRHFAYPNGDYNQYTIEMCRKAGYVTARTIHAGWNSKEADVFQLKTLGISDDANMHKFRFQLAGIYPWLLYLMQYGSFNGRKKIL